MASYDGNTMRLYVNGTEVANKVYGQTMIPVASALQIGNSPANFPFKGSSTRPRFTTRR